MSESMLSKDKLKRLNIAHGLFSELLERKAGYPKAVREELESDLRECERKIKEIEAEKEAENNHLIDFTTKYKIELTESVGTQDGLLIINDIMINVSPSQSDILSILYTQLTNGWFEDNKPEEKGWVSYDLFRESVRKWITDEKNGDIVVNQTITKAIQKLSTRINSKLCLGKDEQLIENGQCYGHAKHYRIRVDPSCFKIVNTN